jgi:hypothetical protein
LRKFKSIFNAGVARHLIRKGNPVYDIKADKNNLDKTIFIFEITDKLNKDLATASVQ